jgi:two-component system, OmpR family, sensor histidine kinase BaeS
VANVRSSLSIPAPDGLARVVVRDSGIGIAPEHLARVFDRFWRADPLGPGTACARMCDGDGLGLAISRDLAHGMGGDLMVESTPGVGSAFTLLLPRA